MPAYRVAILGSGNIGTDLLVKVSRSEHLTCVAFIGRNYGSQGMARARSMNVLCSDQSINYIREHAEEIDLVFDATSAKDHLVHYPILRQLGIKAIDLTPAKIGPLCVPAVNMKESLGADNINMVTCGGQASIPIAYAMRQTQKDIHYIEVVSSIASKSAGPATRLNLDEYINTTEAGIKLFSGAPKTKAILNLNPLLPCIDMQTTIFAKIGSPDIPALKREISLMTLRIQAYVPGYQILLGPILENDRVVVMVKVRGLGDYLPEYAGNLDIINCAAIAMAEEYAKASGT
jgi:acetaldehyde dehydrogenase (acetylating)